MTTAEIAKKYPVSLYLVNKWKQLFDENSYQLIDYKDDIGVEKEME